MSAQADGGFDSLTLRKLKGELRFRIPPPPQTVKKKRFGHYMSELGDFGPFNEEAVNYFINYLKSLATSTAKLQTLVDSQLPPHVKEAMIKTQLGGLLEILPEDVRSLTYVAEDQRNIQTKRDEKIQLKKIRGKNGKTYLTSVGHFHSNEHWTMDNLTEHAAETAKLIGKNWHQDFLQPEINKLKISKN